MALNRRVLHSQESPHSHRPSSPTERKGNKDICQDFFSFFFTLLLMKICSCINQPAMERHPPISSMLSPNQSQAQLATSTSFAHLPQLYLGTAVLPKSQLTYNSNCQQVCKTAVNHPPTPNAHFQPSNYSLMITLYIIIYYLQPFFRMLCSAVSLSEPVNALIFKQINDIEVICSITSHMLTCCQWGSCSLLITTNPIRHLKSPSSD